MNEATIIAIITIITGFFTALFTGINKYVGNKLKDKNDGFELMVKANDKRFGDYDKRLEEKDRQIERLNKRLEEMEEREKEYIRREEKYKVIIEDYAHKAGLTNGEVKAEVTAIISTPDKK